MIEGNWRWKLLFAGLLLSSCTMRSTVKPEMSDVSPRPLRLLALGDSYTIGEGVAERDRWPVQLQSQLEEAGLKVAAPQIIARTGWTTIDLAAAMDTADLQPPYQLVTLQIGVNDQFQGFDVAGYEARFTTLLERAIGLAGGDVSRVVVLSIPDYGVTPFGMSRGEAAISAAVNEFNAANRRITLAAGVAYIDITPISRQAKEDLGLLANDQLHPSSDMYAAWVAEMMPFVQPRIAQP